MFWASRITIETLLEIFLEFFLGKCELLKYINWKYIKIHVFFLQVAKLENLDFKLYDDC